MERFKRFLDADGFRKNIIENSVKFGLIKSNADPAFTNARVERDIDTTLGQKTLKIRESFAINSDGQFLYSPELNNIPVPADTNWYWVRIKYNSTNEEVGTVSLAINGDLVGSGTQFTTTLRGMPNFPSRIRFSNSTYNTLEYDVLEVIDDTHAIIVHPAVNSSGIAEFTVEDNLKYKVVGTMTAGSAVPEENKYPFIYDSLTYELVVETSLNVRPTPTVAGQEFYLARVKVDGASLIVQDKRLDYWETKGSELAINIDRSTNPLIGVEAVKWKHQFSPADCNIVEVAWGMRSQNWTVDSSQNILTLQSALGGKFKTVDDFTNGDFNGWRVYFANGNYHNVISSVKQGSAINLTLDVLDVDNLSTDGGQTFNNTGADADYVLVVPNCEQIVLQFKSEPSDNTPNVDRTFTFPVNTQIGICELLAYKANTCLYNLQYQYQSFKEYTEMIPVSTDLVGHYTEASFDTLGNIKAEADRVRHPYTADPSGGFIQLTLAPFAYHNFTQKVDKGDIIGVNTITNFTSTQVVELVVGVSKNYQYITGDIVLTDDVYISLSNAGAVEGNEFRIHLDATSVGLGGKNLYIVRNYTGGTPDILKKIDQGDVYEMLNHDGGIVFDCVYSGSNWLIYANYDKGESFTVGMMDGVITDYFDPGGWGKVKGYFGRHLCDGNDGVPDLRDRFIVGAGFSYVKGATGGESTTTLTVQNLPPHSHNWKAKFSNDNLGGSGFVASSNGPGGSDTYVDLNTQVEVVGGGVAFENKPPYYALFYFKKMY